MKYLLDQELHQCYGAFVNKLKLSECMQKKNTGKIKNNKQGKQKN